MNSSTEITSRAGRLRFRAAFAAAAVGVGIVALTGPAAPSVLAAPDPCRASEVAKTMAMVATHTGNYLEANPEANEALTTISQQQGGPQSVVALKAYFDANPKVAGDMQRLQQPLVSLSGRCDLPVTVPQVLGLMQAAQQPVAAPSGSLPAAQNVGVDSAPAPAPRAPAAVQGASTR